ncbi:hypothetical protein ECP030230813_4922 [Escherichia coli P0302308.13]|nr:hypothetical protein ECP030230813_4922 [Escherichia coli P0302308.13]
MPITDHPQPSGEMIVLLDQYTATALMAVFNSMSRPCGMMQMVVLELGDWKTAVLLLR